MISEHYETKENPKEAAWRREQQEVEKIVDKLGKPVDPGIKESVIALLVLGLSTDGSCEGHIDRALKAPWVDVAPDFPQRLKDDIRKFHRMGGEPSPKLVMETREIQKELLSQRGRLTKFLDEFYIKRHVPFDRQLILKLHPNHSRILNQGAELQDLNSPERQKQKLREYQEEMAAFTRFLKEKFFSAM